MNIHICRPGPFGPGAGRFASGAKLSVLVGAMLIAWLLKRHYSDARADDLSWILAPTANLVSAVTGVIFTFQPGEGYLSHERMFLIEKSCAGINFMVAAFAMLLFALLHRVWSAASGACVIAASLLASYLSAVLVNTARIAIAMWLAAHPAAIPLLNAADVHRLEGIVVYFGGLVLLYELAQRLDRPTCAVRRAGPSGPARGLRPAN